MVYRRVAARACWCCCVWLALLLPLLAQPEFNPNVPPAAPKLEPAFAKPDLSLRFATTDTVTGVRIFNTTGKYNGDAQRIQAIIPNGTIAVVYVTITNATEANGDFLVKLTKPTENWTVVAAQPGGIENREITAPLFGDGWRLNLAARSNFLLGLLVQAPNQASPLTLGISLISATDRRDFDFAEIAVTSADIPRPPLDLTVKNASSATYIGTNIFGATGDTQRIQQMVPSSTVAVYHVKVTNTSELAQTFRLSIAARIPANEFFKGLSITTYDALKDGMVVTDRYAGPEGGVCMLKPGAALTFRVEIDNQSKNDRLMYAVSVTITGIEERKALDAATLMVAFMGPGAQPDLMAKLPRQTAYLGEGMISDYFRPDPAVQKLDVRCPLGVKTVVHLRVRNTARKPMVYRLQGMRSMMQAVELRYFDSPRGGNDITLAVLSGTWETPALATNAVCDLRLEALVQQKIPPMPYNVQVYAPNGVMGRDTLTLLLTPTTEVAPPAPAKPDLMVKRPQDKTYGNADVYAATGDPKIPTITVQLPVEKRLVIDVRVKNNGTEPAAFNIGPCITRDGWETHYFDAADGKEITDAVKAGTWNTGELDPGAVQDLRLELAAGPTLTTDNALDFPLTVLPADANATGMDVILFKVTRVAGK